MSFSRHKQIYQPDVLFLPFGRRRSCFRLRPRSHRLDEFAASYSLTGCTPALPASASLAGSIFNQPAQLVNHQLRGVGELSTGEMGNFQPELTKPGLILLGSVVCWWNWGTRRLWPMLEISE
jgi:hypothetical protein